MSISDYTKGVDRALFEDDPLKKGANAQRTLDISDLGDDDFWDDDEEMTAMSNSASGITVEATGDTYSIKGNRTAAYVRGTVVALLLFLASIMANALTYSFVFMMVMGYESSVAAAVDNPNMALVVLWTSGILWHALFAWLTVRLMCKVSQGYDREIKYYLIPFVAILVLSAAIFPALTGTFNGVSIYATHAVLLLLFGEIYVKRGGVNTTHTAGKSSARVVNWAVIIPWVLLAAGTCFSIGVARNMYNSGYTQGASDAAEVAATEVESAVKDAYNEGYEKGIDDGYRELNGWYGDYAQEQYDSGYSDGYDVGYNLGHTEGYNQGFMAGSW